MLLRHARLLPGVLALGLVLGGCDKLAGSRGVDDGGAETASDTGDATRVDDAPEVDGDDVTTADPDFTPPVELGRHEVFVADTRQVVPSDGLPPEAVVQQAANNLDVVRHADGRVYLAFRTAPSHFASAEARLHVVSSADEASWRYETSFHLGTDLREPRLLSLPAGDGRPEARLFLYFARLGADATAFEPGEMLQTARDADASWTLPTPFYGPDFIPWRTKVERGVPMMTAYNGGESIYRFDGTPLEVHLLTTADGLEWTGLDPQRPVVSTGGGSETAFTTMDDGRLFAVIRNEAGDETGWGSKICRAPASDLTAWTCVHDPRKYDSPLMFTFDGEAYLIGRRHLTPSGNYDLHRRGFDAVTQTIAYQTEYVRKRKRCALWRYVQDEDRIAFVLDLPSRGDTCFPGVIAGAVPNELVVYNYSSPLEGDDPPWNTGQAGETRIYRHVLRFAPRP